MSYTKVYDKQFIKVGDKYIPMFLAGSSNCTMFWGGKEIYERSWDTIIWNTPLCTEEDIMKIAPTENLDWEWFNEKGRWIYRSSAKKWLKNAINNARTIEEIFLQTGMPLKCAIVIDRKRTEVAYCRTTQEIIDWVENVYSKNTDPKKYVSFSFAGITPLALGKKCDLSKPFYAKHKSMYIVKIGEHSVTFACKNSKSTAKVFQNIDDFIQYTKDMSPLYLPVKFEAVE